MAILATRWVFATDDQKFVAFLCEFDAFTQD
jgi:hypothetical protein